MENLSNTENDLIRIALERLDLNTVSPAMYSTYALLCAQFGAKQAA